MRGIEADVVEPTRRVSLIRRSVARLLLAGLTVSACGLGKLDRSGKKGANAPGSAKSTASAQSQALTEAYNKRGGSLKALPKGGPGSGASSKRGSSANSKSSTRSPNDTTDEPVSFKARMAAFFLKRTGRRPSITGGAQAPAKLRGQYAMSDSGDFFVPCNDTTRYIVQGTTEARYLMVERLRFIVRGLKTPVYAVFTGTIVTPKPAPIAKSAPTPAPQESSTPTAGQKSPKPAGPPVAPKKAIFVSKVDTLTTTFPIACRRSSGSRSAGG